MGKSIKGKELGKGISQRKDGLYQARFTNRFGKRQTIYGKTYTDITQKLRSEQYEDEKQINVIKKDVTLDDWYHIWLATCKKNCRNSSKEAYATHYKRIKEDLGWRKLTSLNLINMQEAINKLNSDNERSNTKKILVDMLNKALDSDLITKNVAKQINTVVTKDVKREKRVLARDEVEKFMSMADGRFYYNLFVLALETGMRIGELCGLQWSDVDLKNKTINVQHTLCYFSKDGKYLFEMHDTKTSNGKRIIPLTTKAVMALKKQKTQKQEIIFDKKEALEGYENLVFVTKNNQPTQLFLIKESLGLIIKNIQKEDVHFKHFTPHTFRHTFATRAIENGMQPKTLQHILGHGTLKMTMDLYCHVTEDTLFAEMEKMEQKRA
uniref:site-specific integrase n=1 Tax=Clostridium sp. 12(A) TaxID=1163671 RepID=UPI000467AE13|nr:site-specific integrase [Clostridium sp. 12(A)]